MRRFTIIMVVMPVSIRNKISGLTSLFTLAALNFIGFSQDPQSTFLDAGLAQSPSVKNEVKTDTSYWSHPKADAVLKLWRCPEQGACVQIHHLDPEDPAIRKLAARTYKKDAGEVTDEEVLAFCGYKAKNRNMSKRGGSGNSPDDLGKWKGKILLSRPGESDAQARRRGAHVLSFWLEQRSDSQLFMRVKKKVLWFGLDESTNFIPDSDPPPACQRPSANP